MHKIHMSDNGFVTVEIGNESATAKIALQGAHIFEYNRYAEPALLWVSRDAVFETGKAIRGGIPVCWPWFGKNPEQPAWPQHGFVRTAPWKLAGVNEPNDLLSEVTLTLDHTQVRQAYFPYPFRLTMRISIGERLAVSLTTDNTGSEPFTITEALHTYFNVGSIAAVNIIGLEGITYADALDGFKRKYTDSTIGIAKEIDRVYLDTLDTIILQDDRLGRNIIIGKEGSESTVVWNPWIKKAQAMSDFEDEGYTSMVCIETANALTNGVTINPGASHTITQTIK